MVEYTLDLDLVFGSLADPTRRDILQRVTRCELTIGEIAKDYQMTFAAVSKHLKILEKARLVEKRRDGKKQYVQASPAALRDVAEYLEHYRQLLETRFDALDKVLAEAQDKKKGASHGRK